MGWLKKRRMTKMGQCCSKCKYKEEYPLITCCNNPDLQITKFDHYKGLIKVRRWPYVTELVWGTRYCHFESR